MDHFAVNFYFTDDWESGFTASLSIFNHSSNDVSGWTLEFEASFEITHLWGAEIIGKEGNHYTITNLDYNSTLVDGGSVSISLKGTPGNSAEPTHYIVQGKPIAGSSLIPTLLVNELTVTEGDSAAQNAIFAVKLSASSTESITVESIAVDDTATVGFDDTAQFDIFTLPTGETSQTISVPLLLVQEGRRQNLPLTQPTPNPSEKGNRREERLYNSFSNLFSLAGNFLPTALELPLNNLNVTDNNNFEALLLELLLNNRTVTGNNDRVIEDDDFVPSLPELSINELTVTDSDTPELVLSELGINNLTVTEEDSTQDATLTTNLSASSNESVKAEGRGQKAEGKEQVCKVKVDDNCLSELDTILTSATGETSQTISLLIIGEANFPSNETITVNLDNLNNATITDSQEVASVDDDDSTPVLPELPIDETTVTEDDNGTIDNDDSLPELSINNVTVTEGDSGTLDAIFTVNLSAASSESITVEYSTANETAIAGSDYTAQSGTITFNPGETSQTISVPVIGETIFEGNETFIVNLDNPNNATVANPQGIGTIDNDDSLPELSINNVTVTEGDSGTLDATFTVSLSAASSESVTVEYSTADETAIAGLDYTAQSGIIIFNPGETSQTITIPVIGETIFESDETFIVNLDNPNNATVANAQGIGTIDNDDSLPELSIDNVTVTEGDSGTLDATFTVNLSAASSESITVEYTTADDTAIAGLDYTAQSGLLTFNPGETSQTISVPVIGETIFESDETFIVNLDNVNNATVANPQGIGTIDNDDSLPELSINSVTVSEGDSGTQNATFTVSLSAASSESITVEYSTADDTATAGSDYITKSGILTFNPGETSQTISVPVIGEAIFEENETFIVNLDNPNNAAIANAQGVGTIDNDDSIPELSIDNVTITEGDSGTLDATFTVNLSAASSESITVEYATADETAIAGLDYTAQSGTIIFNPGETSQTISVPVIGETIFEGNETFIVNLDNPNNATVANPQGVGIIANDDSVPELSINDVTLTEGDSGTQNATFSVNLSAASGESITVEYSTADDTAIAGLDYTAQSGTIIFNPGETSQTISVPVIGEAIFEENETFIVNLDNPNNATVANAQGVGTIDNDDSIPELSINNVTITEGDSGTLDATFTVSLSAASSELITVEYATANDTAIAGLDYTAQSGTIIFNPGETSQTITVPVIGETNFEENETFIVNLNNPNNAAIANAQGTGTIEDDDFNYGEALQKSILFYYGQRSGELLDTNPFPWRGDSAVNDGSDVGIDLSGGYYDAGDHVKFGLPGAASMTMLSWGAIEYRDAYQQSGQLAEILDSIKWGTDYFLKAHITDHQGTKEFYGQVGDGNIDHAYWGAPEDMMMERPAYKIDRQNPGSDLAGETAASLAAASIAFRTIDEAYADTVNDPDGDYSDFAEGQIDYILGDNPQEFSYMVGFGDNYPLNYHHRAASGVTDIDDPRDNLYTLYGALVGGPAAADDADYVDERTDYIRNEVALDYNAGLTGALARMYQEFGGQSLDSIVGLNLDNLNGLTVAD
ncbi:MAG: hypothetical protein F6J96_24880 [Symploca sp. SIO1C2]|nr:hypothetical protein [Symploca sp. SIO1C2]